MRPRSQEPASRAGRGREVVIDAAHLNFHTEDGGYAPFAKLLRLDRYRVEPNREPFTASSLRGADVLVIANAMHKQSEADWVPLPNYSAFTDAEIAEVEAWVRLGGSLLLIADHMPLAGHAEGSQQLSEFDFRMDSLWTLPAAGRSHCADRTALCRQGRLPMAGKRANGLHR